MPIPEGSHPERKLGRVHRGEHSPPANIGPTKGPSPTARLDAMTQELVRALEDDKIRLLAEIKELQSRIDQLGPENARLAEALANAESNNVFATILMALGGFVVSYATFTGNAAPALANAAVGCLMTGIALMAWQSWRRKRRP